MGLVRSGALLLDFDDLDSLRHVDVGRGARRRKLLEQRLAWLPAETESRLSHSFCRAFLAELLALEIPIESVEEEAIVRYRKPVEDLLFFLRPNAVVLEEELEKFGLPTELFSAGRSRFWRRLTFGSSSVASTPLFKFRRSLKTPSSNFFAFLTGRPKARNLKLSARTMSVPVT